MCLVGRLTPMTRKKCIAQKIQLGMTTVNSQNRFIDDRKPHRDLRERILGC
jgi:hypothetical protein